VTGITRVDFHCHSTYSDGVLVPRELAEQLAAAGVAFAALTDHDTVGGLADFRRTLGRRDVGCIAGVEMTTQRGGEEVHLLGYGFDPENAQLQVAMLSVRKARPAGSESVAGSIRNMGSHDPGAINSVAASGRIEIGEAIALIHRAGGRAFLAHPLALEPDFDKLRDIVSELKDQGLDGIEAFYGAHTDQERERLREMAEDLGLLVCGGSDWHGPRGTDGGGLGVDMPTELWKQFRDEVCREPSAAGQTPSLSAAAVPRHRLKKRHFALHVVLPTFLAIALFAVAIFAVMIPAFERSLLKHKREMIRELTRSAWSILAGYEQDERAGTLSRAQAQKLAAARIELIRYGREGKDYFWLQDMQPRIIMHPYRKDLDGRDVSEFVDARGVRIFVEFADLVRRKGEGYIDYVWQWKDDPNRLAPKESYVKGFAPWGWIIGTGIYLDDVHGEITAVKRRLVQTSLGISVVVALLLLYVMRHVLSIERRRSEAEEGLRESTERYRSLVEATTEGTLLALDGRCYYANPILLRMLGCSERMLSLLDLADVIPPGEGNETAWERINLLLAGEASGGGFDGVIRRRDGVLIECVFAISPIEFSGQSGLIVLVTEIGMVEGRESGGDQRGALLAHVFDNMPGGVFRARATAQGTVLSASVSAAKLLRPTDEPDDAPLTLSTLFEDEAAYREFLAEVSREGRAERRLRVESVDAGARTLAIRAAFTAGVAEESALVDGIIEDVTIEDRRAAEREAQFNRLQASMLFLHEPVSKIERSAVFCQLDDSVQRVAVMMTGSESSAALVRAESGEVIGIFTDSDLRTRVVAAGGDMTSPVSRVMSSPVVSVSEDAGIYEALLAMEENRVGHLAVVDDADEIIGVIRERELLGFQSYGPIVLNREVARSTTAAQVVSSCRRAPSIATALLDSGARPHRVTRMITSVCDAAVERFVALAEEELGQPPTDFAFVALGSQGREELALSSDQDNAIIFADGAEDMSGYFNELGNRVCGWLDEAGYPLCAGDVMARNPKWCQPLSVWKQYFTDWIHRSEAEELMEFSIFFDCRSVCGEEKLGDELRAHVYAALGEQPAFFPNLAQNALAFRPPARLFGRILSTSGAGGQADMLDLKDSLAPIVSFARLYALRERLDRTHTLDRLDALAEAGALAQSTRDDTVAAYDLLMRLRLEHQAQALDSGQPLDNLINYRKLGHLEATLVNQALAQIAAVQKRISYDFLGGT